MAAAAPIIAAAGYTGYFILTRAVALSGSAHNSLSHWHFLRMQSSIDKKAARAETARLLAIEQQHSKETELIEDDFKAESLNSTLQEITDLSDEINGSESDRDICRDMKNELIRVTSLGKHSEEIESNKGLLEIVRARLERHNLTDTTAYEILTAKLRK